MNVPIQVDDNERVIRGVYHKMNFDKKNSLKANALRSPATKDEISVIRLDYCNIDFCRSHFKKIEKTDGDHRKYYGFFCLYVNEIRSVKSDVVSTQQHFKEHADIVHNYIEVQNQEPPLEIRIKIDQLLNIAKSRLRHDPNTSISWKEDII